jgi:bifunctional non-homologous end joining protein LigD
VPAAVDVEVDGRTLRVSNLDKVLYPESGTTKAEVIDYYARVAPAMLPHLAGRHVTLRRFPSGVDGQSFYEKNCPGHRPEWIRTAVVPASSTKEGEINHCLLDSVAALAWTANLAALELHTPMALAEAPEVPRMVVFDLDPGPPADVLDCAEVALQVRDVLAGLDLECVVKTSGSKGLQVYLPLNTPVTHDDTGGFARALAQVLEQHHPDRIVSVQRKDLRTGKVLVDWSQNTFHKTTVCAYSLRARPRPTVSTPVTWDEVEAALDAGDPSSLTFEIGAVLERVERLGDLFAPAVERRQRLPHL